jgi:hypothetical protein
MGALIISLNFQISLKLVKVVDLKIKNRGILK